MKGRCNLSPLIASRTQYLSLTLLCIFQRQPLTVLTYTRVLRKLWISTAFPEADNRSQSPIDVSSPVTTPNQPAFIRPLDADYTSITSPKRRRCASPERDTINMSTEANNAPADNNETCSSLRRSYSQPTMSMPTRSTLQTPPSHTSQTIASSHTQVSNKGEYQQYFEILKGFEGLPKIDNFFIR